MANLPLQTNVQYLDPTPLGQDFPLDQIVPEVESSFSFPERPPGFTDPSTVLPQTQTLDGGVSGGVVQPISHTHITDPYVPKTLYSIDWPLSEIITMFIVYAFIIAAALAAIFIFVGGISFILSGGNDEKVKEAVNTIRYAIVGLIVTILSFFAVTIVGRMFGFNFLDYLSYTQIKSHIEALMQTGIGTPSTQVPFSDRARNQTGGYVPIR